MFFEVACLSKIDIANIADEGAAIVVLSEMVVDIATLGEGGAAAFEFAVEEHFILLGLWIVNLFNSEPVPGYLLKDLGQLVFRLRILYRGREISDLRTYL